MYAPSYFGIAFSVNDLRDVGDGDRLPTVSYLIQSLYIPIYGRRAQYIYYAHKAQITIQLQ